MVAVQVSPTPALARQTAIERQMLKRRKRQTPKKPKHKGINALGDLAVWGCSDEEILAAAQSTWYAPIYSHYRPKVVRITDSSQDPPAPMEILFEFQCIHENPDHEPWSRARRKTGDGTTSLIRKANECDAQRLGLITHKSRDAELNLDGELFSEAYHRAILTMWSAAKHRSFESLVDEFHQMEVSYLRPGTMLPSAVTISRDVKAVHAKYAPRIRDYFQTVQGAIHLAIDGWTSPISESYLGIVVIWYDKHKIYRCILEFIRLTSAHTGEYLAKQVATCLQRYGLENRILAACLDNASNNLTLTQHLQRHIPHFHGERSYVRCLAHIINLMAKAFLLPFSSPSQRSRLVLEQHKLDPKLFTPAVQDFLQVQQAVGDTGEPEDNKDFEAIDPSQFEHDTLVAQGSVLKAIEQVYASQGVAPKASELKDAQSIMSIVSGLARRVNDSPQLKIKLEELVSSSMFPELSNSNCKSLPRRVPTRWDTDRVALNGFLHLRGPVRWLTNEPNLKLQQFSLRETLWPLAEELNEALEVFEVLTKHFSLGDVPLIYQVLPALVDLKNTLSFIRGATNIHAVTRVAAQAAVNVFDKYMANMTICEVYFIAIAMCPDIKLNWFRQHFSPESVEMIRQMILARFSISYPSSLGVYPTHLSNSEESKPSNRWLREMPLSSLSRHTLPSDSDSIEAYLTTDTESMSTYGGVLPYWSTMLETKPRLARMALDYLTAPATSVDVERAFSAGRLTINHLQHNMSPSTFEAKMALGSWYGTPLLPELSEVASVIESGM